MKKRWVIALSIMLLAFAMPLALLEYTHSNQSTDLKTGEHRSRPDGPIITTYSRVMDFSCSPEHPLCAVAEAKGVYARLGVPRLPAILAGVILPSLLMVASIVVALNKKWATITGLCLAALLCATQCIAYRERFVMYHHTSPSVENIYSFDDLKYTSMTQHGEPIEDFNASPLAELPIWGRTEAGRMGSHRQLGTLGGFYERDVIPRPLAIVGGLVLPLFMLMIAAAMTLRPLLIRTRPF